MPSCSAATRLGSLVLASLAVTAVACKAEVKVTTLPDAPPPQRAAASFVHCIEMGSSQCIETGDTVGGWDAFYILGWLGGGSPVSILEALPSELEAHSDPRFVQRRFVTEVERYAEAIRGGACNAAEMQPIDPLIDQVAAVAEERMSRLGMWQGDMSEVMRGLVEEAHESLGGGYLVRMECDYDPHRMWLATRERDGHYSVIGLTTYLPHFIGGEPPGREDVRDRLTSRSLGLANAQAPIIEGAVHAWLPFPVEEF